PHGDPIPREFFSHQEHGEAPLARSRPGDLFLVQRVYDSDSGALRDLAEFGIRPGVVLQVERRTSEVGPMWVRIGDQKVRLSSALVNLIQGERPGDVMTLDELPHAGRGVVTSIDAQGPERRRLMDLGLLPGVEVVAEGTSPLGDPTAYLVCGSVIALRRAQARGVHIVQRAER
ncbi:MAG: ferrous iron transport protein A, partial [Nocardioides sp.]|nr:ferrous iron transport protein A [Nocardioides sp.]